jgi:hypothetical protein
MLIPNNDARRKKPTLSAHQKQMRFFTGLALFISLLFVAAVFWFLNRAGFYIR